MAAGDMRPVVAPGGEIELVIGDGAGAAVAGSEALIATFQRACATSRECTDVWRNDGDRYVQSLPDPAFIRSHRLERDIPEAIGWRALLCASHRLRLRRVELPVELTFRRI